MTINNLQINVGEDFYAKLFIRSGQNKAPKNLAGCEIFGGVKTLYSDSEPIFVFDVTIVDALNGIVEIKAPRPVVARLQQSATKAESTSGKFVYDVCLREPSGVKRILGGTLLAIFTAQ